MALVLANRVQETSATTGTGTLTLAGAVPGFQSFAAGIGSGNTCYYTITNAAGSWEVGVGTVGTGTLARTTLLSSSTGSFISFTGALNVFVTYPSEKSVNLDASNNLTVLNTTRLGGLSGNQSLQVINTVSGVNYAQIASGTAGGSPVYYAQGADANINLAFGTKGTGQYFFSTGGGLQFAIGNAASAVNYFQLNGSATGGSANMSAQGSDANVGLGYFSKNNGFHFFYAASVAQVAIAPTASAVNYLNFTGAATGAAPTISAQGSDANISLNFAQKGTGNFQFNSSTSVALQIFTGTGNLNYFRLTAGTTGNAPELSAQGSDSNINLKLTTKGTGTVQFGTHTAGIVAQAGYITITDAGGTSRRLLVG